MSAPRPSANVFGSFLDTVGTVSRAEPSPVSGFAKSATDWFGSHEAVVGGSDKSAGKGQTEIIPALLEGVASMSGPATILDLVTKTNLTVDAAAAGLRDAVGTGLLRPTDRADGGREFELTPLGSELVRSMAR